MKWKWLARAILIASAVVIAAIAGTIVWFDRQFERYAREPMVMGLEQGLPEKTEQPHYRGPHPSKMRRPADPFDYPIRVGETGPVAPYFAGPLEYPFLCESEEAGFGQPLVDNQEGDGVAVYAVTESGSKTTEIVGFSRDCRLETRAFYLYNRRGTRRFFPLTPDADDVARISVDGESTDFIVRVEVGTINRFIYLIIAPKGPEESLEQPDNRHWNRRLIYQFRGGVGIGRRQRTLSLRGVLKERYEQLARGYAVATSSGNRTSGHYDIWLAEDTASRVKRQFTALYGKPLYTVGVGGSGGAIQQYLIGQNNPELLDAAIALYSFPDMVTQTTPVLDCELLEYYFDVTAAEKEKWRHWENRQWIEGLNASAEVSRRLRPLSWIVDLMNSRAPNFRGGSTECVRSWRFLTPLIHNPHYAHFSPLFEPHLAENTHWTYWEDLRPFFGADQAGYANDTWDNTGVQYGLSALRNGLITVDEFLHLNASIGSWKPPRDMRGERLWRFPAARSGLAELSLWSHHNMRLTDDPVARPAPRAVGDLEAMHGAYYSGQVFVGAIDIPVLDLRHYLEHELDMHHSAATFSARARMQAARGHADNQVVWMTRKPHTPLQDAFDIIDGWMLAIRSNPEKSVVSNKPSNAVDTCFGPDGEIIARGDDVWDGAWNGKATGRCSRAYPIYPNSRIIAGDDYAADTFKCHLQTIEQAIDKGLYGDVDMTSHAARLKQIFPEGVCDYGLGDAGRPADLVTAEAPIQGAPRGSRGARGR